MRLLSNSSRPAEVHGLGATPAAGCWLARLAGALLFLAAGILAAAPDASGQAARQEERLVLVLQGDIKATPGGKPTVVTGAPASSEGQARLLGVLQVENAADRPGFYRFRISWTAIVAGREGAHDFRRDLDRPLKSQFLAAELTIPKGAEFSATGPLDPVQAAFR